MQIAVQDGHVMWFNFVIRLFNKFFLYFAKKLIFKVYSSAVEHWTFNPLVLGSIPNTLILFR